ncbi:MAG: hypothetical protein VX737_03875 [Pseudomonadota bacterium]|nr:hypothetical protein [Pseudomonadota bacterium]
MNIKNMKPMPFVFINDANLLHISLILGDLDTFSHLVTHYPYLLKSTQQKLFYTATDQNPVVMDSEVITRDLFPLLILAFGEKGLTDLLFYSDAIPPTIKLNFLAEIIPKVFSPRFTRAPDIIKLRYILDIMPDRLFGYYGFFMQCMDLALAHNTFFGNQLLHGAIKNVLSRFLKLIEKEIKQKKFISLSELKAFLCLDQKRPYAKGEAGKIIQEIIDENILYRDLLDRLECVNFPLGEWTGNGWTIDIAPYTSESLQRDYLSQFIIFRANIFEHSYFLKNHSKTNDIESLMDASCGIKNLVCSFPTKQRFVNIFKILVLIRVIFVLLGNEMITNHIYAMKNVLVNGFIGFGFTSLEVKSLDIDPLNSCKLSTQLESHDVEGVSVEDMVSQYTESLSL